MNHPTRKAVCPYCGKLLSTYVAAATIESIHGPAKYQFRSHKNLYGQPCAGWAKVVPDDAFIDGAPNLNSLEEF